MSVTKTARQESAATFVDVSGGESLLYRLTVRGVRPVFTLVDAEVNELLLSNKDNPVSNSPLIYERRWPLPADSRETTTNHTLGMSFLAAPMTYTYVVEQHHPNGSVTVLNDIDFAATAPSDWEFQGLIVTTD